MRETLPPSHKLLLDSCRAKFIVFSLEYTGHIAADIVDPGSQETLISCSIGLPLFIIYNASHSLHSHEWGLLTVMVGISSELFVVAGL
jgi:hypothetical protein